MHILFLILKIAGMILGILLLLLVLLICAVLFVPIRYQARGTLDDTQEFHIRATWLLFVLRILCEIQSKEAAVKVKLFGFPVFQYPKPEQETGGRKRKRRRKKDKQEKQAKDQEIKETQNEKKQARTEEVPKLQESPSVDFDETDKSVEKEIEDELQYMTQPEKDTTELKGIKSGRKEKKKPKINLFLKIREWILKIHQKIKQILKKIAQMKDMIYDEDNRAMAAHVIQEFKYLFRHISPRKMTMHMRFATGDPALTGQLLGGLCILPVMYRYDMHLVPDFEADSFYFKGNFKLKGHIRMIHVLCSGIRLFKDKNIRKLIGK